MMTEPKVVGREPQPYAAINLILRQAEVAGTAPPLIDKVIAWLRAHGMEPSGPPFFNYVDFWPDGRMQMQVGMPTATQAPADAAIATGTLPGGRYASLVLTGPYHELMDANMALDGWVRRQGYAFAGDETAEGFRGATRLEIYHKDPGEDPSGHPVTEVAFQLAD